VHQPMPDLAMLPALGMPLLPAFLVWTPIPDLGMTLLPAFPASLDPRQLRPSTLSHETFISFESLNPTRLRLKLDGFALAIRLSLLTRHGFGLRRLPILSVEYPSRYGAVYFSFREVS
jgi:hypothetical protein